MPPENPTAGEQLARDLHEALVESNKGAAASRELLIEIRDLMRKDLKQRKKTNELLEELAGNAEVALVAADILTDVSNNGKSPTWKDVAMAVNTAVDQVFGDGDDEDGDEGGDGGDEDDGDDPPLTPTDIRKRRVQDR